MRIKRWTDRKNMNNFDRYYAGYLEEALILNRD